MGVDQLVSGGDVANPVYESLVVNGTTTIDTLEAGTADIGKLIAPLDANGYDVSNIGAADMDSATVNSREIYVQPTEPSNPSKGDVWIDTSGVE